MWISGSLYSFVCLPPVIKFGLTQAEIKKQLVCAKDVHDEVALCVEGTSVYIEETFILHHSIHFPFSSHDTFYFFWSLCRSIIHFLSLLSPLPTLCVCAGKQEYKNL